MERINLDFNATTPLEPTVFEAMSAVLRGEGGNPSSLHFLGQRARAAVEVARGEVAGLVCANPADIVFTAGGTEADNLAIRGLALGAPPSRRKVVVTAIEHHAVLRSAEALKSHGFLVAIVRAGADGVVDLSELAREVDEQTAVVACMLANNETGVLQPIQEAVRVARSKGALVHCDAVQALGKVPLDVRSLDVDTMAFSAHKVYGPQGVGALFVRRGAQLKALLKGGAQERHRRAGTENVAGIVGFGQAARVAQEILVSEQEREAALRDRLEGLLLDLPGAKRNGDGPRVSNTTNISFEGAEAESLLMALDLMGISVSTGAACAAGSIEPSHVLKGMGLETARIQSSVRFSLGRPTTADEVSRAAEAVGAALLRQRSLGVARSGARS